MKKFTQVTIALMITLVSYMAHAQVSTVGCDASSIFNQTQVTGNILLGGSKTNQQQLVTDGEFLLESIEIYNTGTNPATGNVRISITEGGNVSANPDLFDLQRQVIFQGNVGTINVPDVMLKANTLYTVGISDPQNGNVRLGFSNQNPIPEGGSTINSSGFNNTNDAAMSLIGFAGEAPTNVSSTIVSSTSVDFTWDNVSGTPNAYEWIIVADGAGVNGTVIQQGTTATNSVSVTGLVEDTAYEFYVVSTSPCELKSASIINEFATPGNPINIIVDYADDNTNPVPTEMNYTDAGVTGVDSGNLDDVNDAIDALVGTDVDTTAEIQAIVDAINAINEVNEDIAGNNNNTPATADQINMYTDGTTTVSGAVVGTDYTTELADNSNFVDFNNPTVAEVQAVIDAVNAQNEAIAEVVEDIAQDNANGTAATAAQINMFTDGMTTVSGAVVGTDYTVAFADDSNFVDPANPTVAEVQAVVDMVNAINEVNEDIAGNANNTPATADQINMYTDGTTTVSGAVVGTDYTTELADNSNFVDFNNPTVAEVQAVIDAVNAENEAIAEVEEDIVGNANNTPATADQINMYTDGTDTVSGAVTGTDYTDGLANGTYVDPANPTVAEVQAVIDAVNAQNAAIAEVEEDIAGNANNTPATADQINMYTDGTDTVSGAVPGTDYTDELDNPTNYTDINNPTVAEVQAIVTGVNNGTLSLESNVIVDFRMFPNPSTNGTVTIQLNNTQSLLNITLFDMLGKRVLLSKSKRLSTHNLKAGTYIVKVDTDKGSTTKRLVIK